MTTLGQYMRSLRLCQTDMPLGKMAAKVGCTKSYLSDLENDKLMPSLLKSVALAKAYKTSLNQMGRYV